MNILVCHQNENVINKIKILERLNYTIFLVNGYVDGINIYNNNEIELIILDYKNSNYFELSKCILEKKQDIKTITISNEICESCREIGGCDNCHKMYKRRRLLNTFEITELIDVIKNFHTKECHYFNTFFQIESILSDILKRFMNVYYENKSKVISLEGNDILVIQNIVEITSLLAEHNIRYSVISEKEIKIT